VQKGWVHSTNFKHSHSFFGPSSSALAVLPFTCTQGRITAMWVIFKEERLSFIVD
jgi:hypothetical protein